MGYGGWIVGAVVGVMGWVGVNALGQSAPATQSAGESLGAAGFRVGADRPVGWRGDGTGRYVGATPPVRWGQSWKQLEELKCAAAVPSDAKDGAGTGATPASLSFFTQWLVAGPVACKDPAAAIKEELIAGEAAMTPRDGDKLGDATWKTVKVEDSFIDLMREVGPMTENQAAYAQACLYAAKPTKIWFHFVHVRGMTFWLNGKVVHSNAETLVNNGAADMGPTLELELKAGWNRFLFKLTSRVTDATDFPSACFLRCRFWPAEAAKDYVSKNVAWISLMPGLTQSAPIVVGDCIYTMAQPYNLVCVDKKTGKVRWIRQNSPYDGATAEERKTKGDVFAKLDPLAAKREQYYRDFVAGKRPDAAAVKAEMDIENEMDKLMLEVDKDRYKRPAEQGEPDWWTIPTPASDGKGVFVFLTRGVSAGYELDGTRRWIRYERPLKQHHGFFGSPAIADRKLVILDGTVTALDLADGSVKWSNDLETVKGWRLWFGSLTRAVVDGTEFVLCPGGNVVMRASDGRIFGKQGAGNFDSTPVFQDGMTWQPAAEDLWRYTLKSSEGSAVFGAASRGKVPARQNLLGRNFYQGHFLEASPLIHDGLVYVVTGHGVLMVFDVSTMELVYRKELPLDLYQAAHQGQYFGAAPTVGGSNIYLMGSTGVTLVIKPGRAYEEIARNRIQYYAHSGRALGNYRYFTYNKKFCPEYQDNTMTAAPVFDGESMYLRGEENLYCIREESGR